MDNLPGWVKKTHNMWLGVSAFLVISVAQGIEIPDFLLSIFSEDFWNATIGAISTVIAYFQYVRGEFAKKVAETQIRVQSVRSKLMYIVNPFKNY
jgi:hypothetical protein